MNGRIHPLDLKSAVANFLIQILKSIRKYFENRREFLDIFNPSKGGL